MGYKLIQQALTAGSALTDLERCVLVAMCAQAHDRDRPPTYWGGHDALAVQLRGDDTDASRQTIKRAVRTLSTKGFVRLVEKGHTGRQAIYELEPLAHVQPGLFDLP